MNKINKLVGQSIVALKGSFGEIGRKRGIELTYILFSDKETYMVLDEQDAYSYHDYSTMARDIYIRKDRVMWQRILSECPDVTCDGFVM